MVPGSRIRCNDLCYVLGHFPHIYHFFTMVKHKLYRHKLPDRTLISCSRPVSYFWTRFDISAKTPAVGKCYIDSSSPEISTSALNTVADFAILILPIIVIVGLQLKIERKIALVCVFLVGSL